MKIHVLAENTAISPEFGKEHGLSLFLETKAGNILFDFGQSNLFYENSRKMGLDVESVRFAVLSHGHYDHGGGLPLFLEKNRNAHVYVSPWAWQPHYKGHIKFIGLPPVESNRLIPVREPTALAEGVSLDPWEEGCRLEGNGEMFTVEDGRWKADDFRHEQYLLVKEQGKTILFSGCSHKGILSILKNFRPDVLVGGFHFKELDPGDMEPYAQALLQYPTMYYTCHCTGIAQYDRLKEIMGNRLEYISGGQSLAI